MISQNKFQEMKLSKALQSHVEQRYDRLVDVATLITFKNLFKNVRAQDGAEYQSDKILIKPNRTNKYSLYRTNNILNFNKVDRNRLINELSHKDGAHTLGFKLINVPK